MLKLSNKISNLGTETAFTVLARAATLQAEGRDIINLGIGQPDFATPDHIVEAGVKALRDGHHGYTPPNGILPLREAVCRDLNRRHGADINPDRIIVVPGGKVTMFFAISMFGEAGAEILYPNPGFPIYESAISYTGATPVLYPLREENGFGFSADDLIARVTAKTRLIILNSPANPTGGVTPVEEMDKLAAFLTERPDIAILSDEIYSNMLYDGRVHRSILEYEALQDRAIMLDGWSKTYAMTGWRLGYAVWPESLVEAATKLCVNDHSCVNASAQFAGIAALDGPQEPVHEMVAAFDHRRKITVERLRALPGFRCADPAGAFYCFPNITGTGMTSRDAQTLFLETAGVATIAGTSFGSEGEGFLRFSYANSAENIEAAIDRIAKLL